MKALHYACVLGAVCLMATLGIASTMALTHDRIQSNERQERLLAQSRVVKAVTFKSLKPGAPEDEQVWQAMDDTGRIVGYESLGEGHGYGGKIRVLVGMDESAQIVVGAVIVEQNETPGLGSRVADIESRRTWVSVITGQAQKGEEDTVPQFLQQIQGRKVDEIVLKDTAHPHGVQAITGATVSSRGVVQATHDGVRKIQSIVAGNTPTPPDAVTSATATVSSN